MKFSKEIKDFDPSHFFHDHMVSVGFTSTLINTFIIGEEEGNNNHTLDECIEKKVGYIGTITSTMEQYNKKCKHPNERNAHSLIVYQKNTQSRKNSQSTNYQHIRSSMNN
jgi:hypothetical protein